MEQNTQLAFIDSNKLMNVIKKVKHILQRALNEQKMIKIWPKQFFILEINI